MKRSTGVTVMAILLILAGGFMALGSLVSSVAGEGMMEAQRAQLEATLQDLPVGTQEGQLPPAQAMEMREQLEVMMEEMDLSHSDFGLFYSAAMIGIILLRIPWGLIGDRIGYLNTFRIALPLSAAAALLRAFSQNYSMLLLSQLFLGLSLAAVLPCLPLIVKEWSPGSLGFSTGIYIAGFAAGNATALGVTPTLQQDSLINLKIRPSIGDLTGWTPDGYPIVFERSLNTEVNVKDNTIFVLGGLKKKETNL